MTKGGREGGRERRKEGRRAAEWKVGKEGGREGRREGSWGGREVVRMALTVDHERYFICIIRNTQTYTELASVQKHSDFAVWCGV